MTVEVECNFCPSKEELPEVGMPEGWTSWQVSPNISLIFCRACVPRVAQFLAQNLGDRIAVLVPNRDCPYCLAQTEREMQEEEQERDAQPKPRVTRDMALDAGDPSLEGQVS